MTPRLVAFLALSSLAVHVPALADAPVLAAGDQRTVLASRQMQRLGAGRFLLDAPVPAPALVQHSARREASWVRYHAATRVAERGDRGRRCCAAIGCVDRHFGRRSRRCEPRRPPYGRTGGRRRRPDLRGCGESLRLRDGPRRIRSQSSPRRASTDSRPDCQRRWQCSRGFEPPGFGWRGRSAGLRRARFLGDGRCPGRSATLPWRRTMEACGFLAPSGVVNVTSTGRLLDGGFGHGATRIQALGNDAIALINGGELEVRSLRGSLRGHADVGLIQWLTPLPSGGIAVLRGGAAPGAVLSRCRCEHGHAHTAPRVDAYQWHCGRHDGCFRRRRERRSDHRDGARWSAAVDSVAVARTRRATADAPHRRRRGGGVHIGCDGARPLVQRRWCMFEASLSVAPVRACGCAVPESHSVVACWPVRPGELRWRAAARRIRRAGGRSAVSGSFRCT